MNDLDACLTDFAEALGCAPDNEAILTTITRLRETGMTELDRQVLDAAREWLTERTPRDAAEKALAVAVYRAWPEDLDYRENCTCGNPDQCDECPTRAQAEAQIAQWERDSTPIAHR